MAALTRCITRKGHTMCAGMAPEERICDEDAETQLRGSGVWGECRVQVRAVVWAVPLTTRLKSPAAGKTQSVFGKGLGSGRVWVRVCFLGAWVFGARGGSR